MRARRGIVTRYIRQVKGFVILKISAIANIWSEVLGLHAVSITDRFLDLGGDSLKAGRIVARVNSAFGVQVQFQALLEAATVAEMAIAVTSAVLDQVDSEPRSLEDD